MQAKLVDLRQLLPQARFDIRYAGTGNFIGEQVYPCDKAYLLAEAAEALRDTHTAFNALGLGIVIWDAYRPISVSRLFWERTPIHLRSFLGNPTQGGSPHNRGCAVDMTLYSLISGEQLPMPTDFDDFSDQAKMQYIPESMDVKHNRDVLHHTMQAHGFVVREDEWWHYDWKRYADYSLLDIPLDALE